MGVLLPANLSLPAAPGLRYPIDPGVREGMPLIGPKYMQLTLSRQYSYFFIARFSTKVLKFSELNKVYSPFLMLCVKINIHYFDTEISLLLSLNFFAKLLTLIGIEVEAAVLFRYKAASVAVKKKKLFIVYSEHQ